MKPVDTGMDDASVSAIRALSDKVVPLLFISTKTQSHPKETNSTPPRTIKHTYTHIHTDKYKLFIATSLNAS